MSVRELTEAVQDLQYRVRHAEARAEFTESRLREDRSMLADLERERGRADRAESETS